VGTNARWRLIHHAIERDVRKLALAVPSAFGSGRPLISTFGRPNHRMLQIDTLTRLGRTSPPASRAAILAAEAALGRSFPAEYVSLLTLSNGYSPTEGKSARYSICLYAAESLAEMAAAYEVQRYLPRYIYIGSDGGGRGLFLLSGRETSPVYLCGHGAFFTDALREVAVSLESWIEGECDLGDEEYPEPPKRIDVVVARPPRGGIQTLRRACLDLGLQIPVSELSRLLRDLPCTLCGDVPYLPAARLVARLNQDDAFLQTYDHLDAHRRNLLPPFK
jgi:hypothetical protein